MTTYVAITDAEIDQDSPLTQVLMTKYRDNSIAIAEGAAGAPRVDLPAITAAQVEGLAAVAGGSVGSYVFALETGTGFFNFTGNLGGTVAGSTLRPTASGADGSAPALSGTWRRMGQTKGGSSDPVADRTTLFLRIS